MWQVKLTFNMAVLIPRLSTISTTSEVSTPVCQVKAEPGSGQLRASDGRPVAVFRFGAEGGDRLVAQVQGGFAFDPAGHFTHLIDPRSGATPARFARVTVTAPTAGEADALSTAFALAETLPEIPEVTVDRA